MAVLSASLRSIEIMRGEDDEESHSNNADDQNHVNNADDGPVDGPTVLGYVEHLNDNSNQLTLPPKLMYPHSHNLSDAFYMINCTLRAHLHHPMFLSALAPFLPAKSQPFHPLLPHSMPQVIRVELVACHEKIRATSSWRRGPPRYDCAFVNTHPNLDGMRGLDIVRIFLFFSFTYHDKPYPCALVHWYTLIGCDEDTGMWMVKPDEAGDGSPVMSIIHLHSIFRAAHLLPIFGHDHIPRAVTCHNSLDTFAAYYVNKYIDHHAFEIAS